jgi:hypothetical protein
METMYPDYLDDEDEYPEEEDDDLEDDDLEDDDLEDDDDDYAYGPD